jgi:hypothetical protein
MMKLLVSAVVAGLLLAPVSAFALDRVQGVVQRVDTTANQFTIAVAGAQKQQMTFKVSATRFEELELDVADELTVEFDKAECGASAGCVPSAVKVERKS